VCNRALTDPPVSPDLRINRQPDVRPNYLL
jgi:hypothetical protein